MKIKRISTVLLAVIMLFSLIGCQNEAANTSSDLSADNSSEIAVAEKTIAADTVHITDLSELEITVTMPDGSAQKFIMKKFSNL